VTEEVDNFFKMKIGKKIKKFASKTKFKYHILNVTLPNSRKTYINSPKTGKTVRVHMCRGHYRHYVDKGLFGKYYGRFWIQDHVRGNKKKGMLVKDYNIRPNPEFA
jgi:ribosomal protein S19